jgi:hypothetical protein
MKHLTYWVVTQIVLEAALITLVAMALLKSWRWTHRRESLSSGEVVPGKEPPQGSKLVAAMEDKRASLEEFLLRLERQDQKLKKKSVAGASTSTTARNMERGGMSLREQVNGLHLQGLAPEDIARRLGTNLAEVNLALAISRVQPE